MSNVPAGIVAVYVHEGRVVAHVADFNQGSPGGFTVREAQESRVRSAIGLAVVRACCSSLVSDHVDGYTAGLMLQKMPGETHYIPIGHEPSGDRNA